MPESLFNKVAGLKNTFSTEQLQMNASVHQKDTNCISGQQYEISTQVKRN